MLTKANRRSTVHRPTYLDYVGVRRFDENGEVIGEHRFLGLFTSSAYNSNPIDVPLLRRKVAAVVERAEFLPASHDQKDLIAILETYPRDDLFQISVESLYANAMGILRLQERRHVRIFLNREVYGRFVSCIVFLPRDRYTTPVRTQIAAILTEAFQAQSHEWNVRLGESVLARLHFVLHVDPRHPLPSDVDALEAEVAAATRAWVDDFRDTLTATRGEEAALDLLHVWGDAFPAAYRDDFDATETMADLVLLQSLEAEGALAVRLSRATSSTRTSSSTARARSRRSRMSSRASPTWASPSTTNARTTSQPRGLPRRWIKHFRLRVPPHAIATGAVGDLFEDAFLAVLAGRVEDDGFNRLVLLAGLSWREVTLLRAYSRYLRQIGTLYSQTYVVGSPRRAPRHRARARRAVRDPPRSLARRQGDTDRLVDQLEAALDAVTALDEDRILRSLMHLVLATLRTNWFQAAPGDPPPTRVVVKLDPAAIPDAAAPPPAVRDLRVRAPVRGAAPARRARRRGGIRWSDRREDFRTEILGLMKAQRVKNVVIVPSGAKGGFVVKRPPADREALAAEVEACYREFMGGLLDVTDNMQDGEVVPPPRVVRYDGDDPYLVVAADRGTATFSDIANEIATRARLLARRRVRVRRFDRLRPQEDGHHRPGRVGVGHPPLPRSRRRRPEHATSPCSASATCPATCSATACCCRGTSDSSPPSTTGTCSSIRIRTRPSSFAERTRLFELPRSSWDDYDRTAISPGGGVYPRTAKAIAITPEVRARFGLPDDVAAPDAQRADLAPAARARRPALERRDRHVREGPHRVERRGRRQGERRHPRQRRRPPLPASSARAATSG